MWASEQPWSPESQGKVPSASGSGPESQPCLWENFFQLPRGDVPLEVSSAGPLLHGGCYLTAMLSGCQSWSVRILGQYRGQRTGAYSSTGTRALTMHRSLANTPCTNSHPILVNILPSWLIGTHNAHTDPGYTLTWPSLIFPRAPVCGPGYIPLTPCSRWNVLRTPDSGDHCTGLPLIPKDAQGLRL